MDGMLIQHHGLNEYEFEQTLGGSGGQRSLSMEQRVGHKLATEQQQQNLCYKALFTHSCTVSKEETVKILYYFFEKHSLNTNFNSRLIMRWIQVHISIMKCVT